MNAEGGGKSDLSSTWALMVANGFHISTRTKTSYYCYFFRFSIFLFGPNASYLIGFDGLLDLVGNEKVSHSLSRVVSSSPRR